MSHYLAVLWFGCLPCLFLSTLLYFRCFLLPTVAALLFPVLYTLLPVQYSVSFSSYFYFLSFSSSVYFMLHLPACHPVSHRWSSCSLQNVGTIISKATQVKAEIPLVFLAQIARASKILSIQSVFRVACGGKQPQTQNLKPLFLSIQKYCNFFPAVPATLSLFYKSQIYGF